MVAVVIALADEDREPFSRSLELHDALPSLDPSSRRRAVHARPAISPSAAAASPPTAVPSRYAVAVPARSWANSRAAPTTTEEKVVSAPQNPVPTRGRR